MGVPLYAATMRWLSTSLFCAVIIRLWWRDNFRLFVSWRSINILSLICTLNAFTAVLSPSIIEFWLLTQFISNDWGVFGYFLIAVVSRFLFALYQGTCTCITFAVAIMYNHTCTCTGFHVATKIWGGSAINEWAYLVRQILGRYL